MNKVRTKDVVNATGKQIGTLYFFPHSPKILASVTDGDKHYLVGKKTHKEFTKESDARDWIMRHSDIVEEQA